MKRDGRARIVLCSVLLLLAVMAGQTMAAVEKGPYLIYPGNNTQMQVLWQLSTSSANLLRWGTTTSYLDGSTTPSGNTYDQYEYTITGLTPGTMYYYDVANVGSGTFYAAPPDAATDVKFLAFGDTRTYPSTHDAVNSRMITTYEGDSDYQTFAILTADWVANGDDDGQWTSQFFNATTMPNVWEMHANLPVNGCIGNHEYSGSLYRRYWPYPYVGSNWYWSFDYGPVHMVVVDLRSEGGTLGATQKAWLEADLAASTKEWKFVQFHAPVYSAGGSHSNNTNEQAYIQNLCETHGVAIVFNGHNHYYSQALVNGVYHITTGGGGAPLNTPSLSYDPTHLVTVSRTNHFCKIDIHGNTLDFEAVTSGGTTIDTFTISHVVDGTAPTPDPAEWLTYPHATGTTSISMTAATATDDLNDVEYYFACTIGDGHDRDWQSSSTYEDTGLTPDTEYTYRVFVHDTSPANNETAGSDPESARTDIDFPEPGDLDDDGDIDVYDLYLFVLEWGSLDCAVENSWCGFADIAPPYGEVDIRDFGLFAENWEAIEVINHAASDITVSGAVLNGEIILTGGEDPTVTIYWGDDDAGTAGPWDYSEPLGTQGLGAFSTSIGTLTAATTYYYRCYASNAAGGAWAASTEMFDTLPDIGSVWYSQDFDSIGTGTTTAPTGWAVGPYSSYQNGGSSPPGPISNSTLTADDGSSGTKGVSYNYGTTGQSDRAVGNISTTSGGDRGMQLTLTNGTGSSINSFTLSYTGEQWRDYQGAGTQPEKLTVWYDNTDVVGGFVEMGASFQFDSPVTSGTNSALDGNAAANRSMISAIYTPSTPIASGDTIHIIWHDKNDGSTNDHGMAIDDVEITIAGGGSVVEPVVVTDAASSVSASGAVLNGEITSTGNEDPTVIIYWGETDEGTDAGTWDDFVDLGPRGMGAFSTSIGSLTADTTYHYRCYAWNSAGGVWAASSETFDTLVPGSAWYSENFDSIGAYGTVLPTGWIAGGAIGAINEMDPPRAGFFNDTPMLVSSGGVSGGAGEQNQTLNLGSAGASDRAVGSSPSSSEGDRGIQVALVNDTGAELTSINLTYTGEQWRDNQGTCYAASHYSPPYEHAVNEKLIVYISDSPNYSGDSYVERLPAAFEFIAPKDNGDYIPLDGNLPANRVEMLGGEYTFVHPIPAGDTFYILWFDFESDRTSDHYLAIDDVVITLPDTSSLVEYFEDFESGFSGSINNHADWYSNPGPTVSTGVGVAGSVGLSSSVKIFTWKAHPFKWSDLAVGDVVIMGMDFEAIGTTAPLDDDRVGWMITDDSTNSNNIFGVQADPGGGGQNIECYWDGDVWGDDDGRKSIVGTSPANTKWYRMTSTFTKLDSTSCSVDVELVELDGSGNPVGTPVTGSIADTSALSPTSTTEAAPRVEYFNGLPGGYSNTLWPAFKNHQGGTGNADNAYFAIGTP